MNTSLVVKVRSSLEEIKTDCSYTDVFPRGILGAGLEILSSPDMRTMAKRTIFQLGLYQGRTDFVLNDLYRDLDLFDVRYKISNGDTEEIEAMLNEDQMYILRSIIEDSDDSFSNYNYSWGELLAIYSEANKNADLRLHADSVYAVCRLALESGYRIILEDSDLTDFGPGLFRDMLEEDSPAYNKTLAIVSSGLSFKLILNDSQTNLPQSDPIVTKMCLEFPEAKTVTLRVF